VLHDCTSGDAVLHACSTADSAAKQTKYFNAGAQPAIVNTRDVQYAAVRMDSSFAVQPRM
jgi:hypothetical protein